MEVSASQMAVILLSLLSVITTAAALLLANLIAHRPAAISVGMGFSTGVMLSVAGLDLIPQAVELLGSQAAILSAGLGAATLWGIRLLLPNASLVTPDEATAEAIARPARMVAIGLVLHDLPEGFGMANAYLASPSLGLVVALTIAMHNLPEQIAIAIPALASALGS